MSLVEDRLAALPDDLAQLFRDAIAISAARPAAWDQAFEQREDQAWDRAMRAAGFEPSPGYRDRVIPLASELDPGQRAVLELLAEVRGPLLNGWPVHAAAWLRRRWLGIDPPGVIGSPIEWQGEQLPLIHVLRELSRAQRDDEARSLVASLELTRRIEVLVDLELAPLDIDMFGRSTLVSEISVELGGVIDERLADAARAAADRLLDAYAGDHHVGERPTGKLAEGVAMMVFTALVAGRAPIEERHDALLRLSWGDFGDATLRNIAAIPEARRESAVLAAMDEVAFPNHRLRIARLILPHHPFASLLKGVLATLDRLDNPAAALRELGEIAEQHPELASIVHAAREHQPAAPILKVAEILDPVTLADLDPIARRQLEIANRLYGGSEMIAEDILAQTDDEADEVINPRFVQRRRIVDESGQPAYDAWLYNVDSGTVFRAGTEEVVAEVIQFGLETSDPALRIALPDALSEKQNKR